MENRTTGDPGREPATVRVTADGPYELQGDFILHIGDNELRVQNARLCRCGRSAQKPHCDRSHERGPAPEPATDGFESSGEVTQGPVEVRFSERGAIRFHGTVIVQDDAGRELLRRERCMLCGCGASRQQPICDGTHNRVG